jgi:hypothetical protein
MELPPFNHAVVIHCHSQTPLDSPDHWLFPTAEHSNCLVAIRMPTHEGTFYHEEGHEYYWNVLYSPLDRSPDEVYAWQTISVPNPC